ncbi:hypothetical protein [Saccharomonospora azurea]|uniref:hypothetical protein n=1 Tax=Saccharomonospora azurea TaxID=40988 RepID=UPI0012FB941F|nr:hypothetical protein [Saccharomonospora azurea]
MLVAGAPAHATPVDAAQHTVRIERFDEATLQEASRSATALTSADSEAHGRVRQHLDEAARNGRLVDESRIRVAEVADPYSADETITLVWDSPKAPTELLYSRRDTANSDAHNIAIGLQMGGGDTTGMPTERTREAQPGSGYAAVFGIDNMYLEDNGCSTGWFAPSYSSDYDHKIVSCYEAWGLDKTPIFVYNRWALWTPAPSDIWGVTAETVDMEVSARPWTGHEGKIKQLADWAPRHGDSLSTCDSNRNYTVGGSWGGLSGSVTMPINICDKYWLNINAGIGTQNRMTIDFDGVRDGQMYMDIAGKYDAVDQYVLPFWADRNYMQVRVCTPTMCNTEAWAKADSGW